jgi:rhodanese-related sulfurtransferase
VSHAPRFQRICDVARARIRECTVSDVAAWQADGIDFDLVDVREESEWAAGHALGAHHLGRGVIERDIEAACPDTGRRLVLYCGGGYRSALAAASLGDMGYTDVWSLAGGWRAWNQAGAPVTR